MSGHRDLYDSGNSLGCNEKYDTKLGQSNCWQR